MVFFRVLNDDIIVKYAEIVIDFLAIFKNFVCYL